MRKVVSTDGGDRDRRFLQHNGSFLLSAHMSEKKHGHHMILRWCPTNLGSLYTMVPSDLHENASGWFY